MSFGITSIVRRRSLSFEIIAMAVRQSCDMAQMRHILQTRKNIVFLTGTAISEESGVPTFRERGPVWRTYSSADLEHPRSFETCPSTIWEFYNYRRELAIKAEPNPAHYAIAEFEQKYGKERCITTITQNTDHLHVKAGSTNVIELYGNLFLTRCLTCHKVEINYERPICPELANTGSPDMNALDANIPVECLPRCGGCGGLLRPHVVLFGESVDKDVLQRADAAIRDCQLCVVIHTSSLIHPAKTYPPTAAARKAIVAEFNNEPMPKKPKYDFYFEGLCSRTIPLALLG